MGNKETHTEKAKKKMMYTNAFVLSLLGLTTAGRKLSAAKMGDYLEYVGAYEKNYKDNSEFMDHFGLYLDNDDYINECNYNAEHTDEHDPVYCGHNQFSDWTEDEYLGMLGFVGNESEEEDYSDSDDANSEDEGVFLSSSGGL